MSDARVSSLHVYPVKSCGGIALASATVAVTGLVADGVGDREWMIVDRDGHFVTQREFPRLALVALGLSADALAFSAPGTPSLRVPLTGPTREALDVIVWRSDVRGLDAGDAAAAWFSAWLGNEVRLVRFDRSLPRPCNPEFAGDSGAHTFFADGYPLLVIGDGSLAELNERLARGGAGPLPMNRFRPNVVLAGLPPFAEDHLDTVTVGAVVLQLVKPCVRCQVTTTDQATGALGIEPLQTLGAFRMDARLGGVTFGMNAIVRQGAGSALAPGMPAEVAYRF
jgi:uncharacterized protein YcbX